MLILRLPVEDFVADEQQGEFQLMPVDFSPPLVERGNRVECDLARLGCMVTGDVIQDAHGRHALRLAVWCQFEAERLGRADELTYEGRA